MYYPLFSIILLFVTALFFSFAFKREFKVEKTETALSITKKKTRIIKFLTIIVLMGNVLFSLFSKNGIDWTIILALPFIVVLWWIAKKAMAQHQSMDPCTFDFENKKVLTGKKEIDFNQLKELQYHSLYTGSNNRSYALSIVTLNDQILLIQSRNGKEVKEVNELLAEKLGLDTVKITDGGLMGQKKEKVQAIK